MVAQIDALVHNDAHVPVLPVAAGDMLKLSTAIGELTHFLE
jgi:hypothetical protein